MMQLHLLPKTRSGKWAVILMLINWALFIVGSVLPWNDGYAGFEMILQNPPQAIITLLMFASGLATIILALVSLVRFRDHNLLVIASLLSGLYSLLGFIGSILNLFLSAS